MVAPAAPPVYPHTCGEHPRKPSDEIAAGGLSPHLWGTRHRGQTPAGRRRFIPTPVGNTRVTDSGCSLQAGLSPHLWGTPEQRPPSSKQKRFIPTPVGNTCAASSITVVAAVYPHTCGEHWLSTPPYLLMTGLSPHLWGTRPVGRAPAAGPRFIPTPVGNTSAPPSRSDPRAVYPHTCGEHNYALPFQIFLDGLSPHLWGTRLVLVRVRRGLRFIPTPVGNTHSRKIESAWRTVYPHTCGEHWPFDQYRPTPPGLSPHLWGTQDGSEFRAQLVRFIPTPVGNTNRICCSFSLPAVYPHTCGEHGVTSRDDVAEVGLSPHLWGTLNLPQNLHPWKRFIPTPVGNTDWWHCRRTWIAVYPHTCGEHSAVLIDTDGSIGLSPHLWGTPFWWPLDTARSRFIPTPVGNTGVIQNGIMGNAVYPHTCGEHVSVGTGREDDGRFIPTPVGNTARPLLSARRSPVYPHTCGEHSKCILLIQKRKIRA